MRLQSEHALFAKVSTGRLTRELATDLDQGWSAADFDAVMEFDPAGQQRLFTETRWTIGAWRWRRHEWKQALGADLRGPVTTRRERESIEREASQGRAKWRREHAGSKPPAGFVELCRSLRGVPVGATGELIADTAIDEGQEIQHRREASLAVLQELGINIPSQHVRQPGAFVVPVG